MHKDEFQVARIGIVGPESSGKTTMCRFLASRFDTVYVHEYVRGYLRRGHLISRREDLLLVAARQLEIEARRLRKARRFLFCDTDLINLKVWSDEVFGGCDSNLLDLVNKQQQDLYLLLKPDLPWSQDGIRQGEADRTRLFEIYRHEIELTKTPFIEVAGLGCRRYELVLEELLHRFGS